MGLYESLRIDESDVGKQFGNRTQIGPAFLCQIRSGGRYRYAVCECTCGDVKVLEIANLKRFRGGCHSCASTKHGWRRTPEYSVWKSIIQRCTNRNTNCFPRYGGRGILVCERWRNSFVDFVADVGQRPSPGHQIDRINNDGNYEPGNCRWATPQQNRNNRPDVLRVCYRGNIMTVTELAALAGIRYSTMVARIKRGWNVERAVFAPVLQPVQPQAAPPP